MAFPTEKNDMDKYNNVSYVSGYNIVYKNITIHYKSNNYDHVLGQINLDRAIMPVQIVLTIITITLQTDMDIIIVICYYIYSP